MNVSLTPQLEELVNRKVASGMYHSASEVIREALRLLDEQDRGRELRLAELRKDIVAGIEQADAGKTKPFDQAAADRIKTEGRKRLTQRRKKQ